MRDTTRLTRRRWLAACGGAAATSLAGCLGGDTDGGDGGDSGGSGSGSGDDSGGTDGGDGGSDGGSDDDQPEIRGQLDVEETVTETTDWEYDLEKGQTITAVFESESAAQAEIYEGDSVSIMDGLTVTPGEPDIAQYTAEESRMYRVYTVPWEDPVTVKIYVTPA